MERTTPAAKGAEPASYERLTRLGRNLLVIAAICAVGAALCYATDVPLGQTLAFGAALSGGEKFGRRDVHLLAFRLLRD